MRKIADYGNGVEIWLVAGSYFVYGVLLNGDAYECPSEGMARDVAGGVL